MSIWLEIHCDKGIEFGVSDCANYNHDYGTALSSQTQTAYDAAKRMALAKGWAQHRGKWICPGCRRKLRI